VLAEVWPMRHVHQEVRVEAPVKRVWELACAWERQPEWNPYMKVENVSGPVNRVGTTFDTTLRLIGQTIRSTGEITAVDPLRLIHIHGKADSGGESDWIYRFEPDGEATRCSLDIDYDAPGLVQGVMDVLVYHGALDRAAKHMAENFAAVATEKVPLPV
jgi:uncharacterized membrane protein